MCSWKVSAREEGSCTYASVVWALRRCLDAEHYMPITNLRMTNEMWCDP